MEEALLSFQKAYYNNSAIELGACLSPIPPKDEPGRLYDFWRSSNDARVEHDVRNAITYMLNGRPRAEIQAWVDVWAGFWRSVDKILKAEQAQNQGKLAEQQTVQVYDTWRDLTSTFMRHMGNGTLPYWVIFTLYFIANNLRKFAIQADAQLAKAKPVAFNAGFQDDIVATAPKSEKLEEAARVISRIFALCMSDRWVQRSSVPVVVLNLAEILI